MIIHVIVALILFFLVANFLIDDYYNKINNRIDKKIKELDNQIEDLRNFLNILKKKYPKKID